MSLRGPVPGIGDDLGMRDLLSFGLLLARRVLRAAVDSSLFDEKPVVVDPWRGAGQRPEPSDLLQEIGPVSTKAKALLRLPPLLGRRWEPGRQAGQRRQDRLPDQPAS